MYFNAKLVDFFYIHWNEITMHYATTKHQILLHWVRLLSNNHEVGKPAKKSRSQGDRVVCGALSSQFLKEKGEK